MHYRFTYLPRVIALLLKNIPQVYILPIKIQLELMRVKMAIMLNAFRVIPKLFHVSSISLQSVPMGRSRG